MRSLIEKRRQRRFGYNLFSVHVKEKISKIREVIYLCIKKMKMMKLEPSEVNIYKDIVSKLTNDKIILKKPYEREGSYIFFTAVRKG